MGKPLVSVVIPTFDRKDFVKGAIENALDQSYENLEVIVVEDGSNCGVEKFISGLGDHRLIYTRHKGNLKLGASRNTGMKLAKGEYIAFLDDDDRWLKNKIRLQVDMMQKYRNNKVMIYCFNTKERGQNRFYKIPMAARGPMVNSIFQGFLLPSSSMLINRSALESIGGHSADLMSCIDHDMWMKLARNGFDMDLVEKGLVYSVDDERKRMVNQFDDRLTGIKQFFIKWKPAIIEEYKIESWMKIERKYHIQTAYAIVNSYRKGIISASEGIDYLKELFLLQSSHFTRFDMLIARFGLRFSTRLFNIVPINRLNRDAFLSIKLH